MRRRRSLESARSRRPAGDLLHDHVRFAERHLFVLLEERLEPVALAELGSEVAAAEDY